jgi:pilus assembly protein CpaC
MIMFGSHILKSLGSASGLAAILAVSLAGPASAQVMQASTGPTVSSSNANSRSVELGLNMSAVIDLPVDAAAIVIGNAEVADLVLRSPRRVLVMGVAAGSTNAFFFDASGRQILSLDIRVQNDLASLDELLRRLVPGGKLRATPVGDTIILEGEVMSLAEASSAIKLAQRFVDEPDQVVSMVTIRGNDQVMLQVRVVEMQRSVTKQLGINLGGVALLDDVLGGDINFGFDVSNAFSLAGRTLGGFDGNTSWVNNGGGDLRSASAAINALERVGLVRTLAEPVLTAISGESAKFLSGGEFPVPVAQDEQGRITVEFKPFGVGLGFTPVVLSEGRISLKVSTEVSELTTQGAFQPETVAGIDGSGNVITAQTVSIPALKVRRVETTVETPSGGSLIIGGLIQSKSQQNLDGMPGAKDLPILGALFRSRDFQNDETELVVIVTPYLVDPTDPRRLRTPGQGFGNAGDLSTVFLGKINETYRVPGSDTGAKKFLGPFGFILD